jgi:hypothetical protein
VAEKNVVAWLKNLIGILKSALFENTEMNKKLGRIENKLLQYFNIAANGCKDYVKSCDYSPYYCGYSEGRETTISTYELCLFVAGIIKCPGEIEKHYCDKHNDSTCWSVLRAIESLEKKGYISRKKVTEHPGNTNGKWFRTYNLATVEY